MNKDIQKWDKIALKYAEATLNDLFRKKFLYPLILKSLGDIKESGFSVSLVTVFGFLIIFMLSKTIL